VQGLFNICKSTNITQHITGINAKTHMISSINAEKALDKIQHLFMRQALRKLGIKGTFLNIIKAINNKHVANIVLNGEKVKAFSLKSRVT
jgi:hypothetical protein